MKHAMKYTFAIFLVLTLSACTQGVKPQTPREAFALAQGTYDAAAALAIKYEALPPCGGTTALCRDASVVAKIKASNLAASNSLDAAEKTIDDPKFAAGGVQAALVAAQNALALITAITTQLGLKP